MFRIYFLYNHDLLPKLFHCGWGAVKEVFHATLGRDDVTPGLVINIQTYGRWANWNPHLHGIASDGCFDNEGNFYHLPKISNITLEKVFTAKVLAMLSEEKLITEDMPKKILSWKHTGFSAHTKVCIKKNFEVYNVLEFLVALTSHIPKTGRKMTIYYGWYSQANRGKRKRNGIRYTKSITSQIEDDNRTLRYRWSQLIKKIYADPFICPNCGGRMKIR